MSNALSYEYLVRRVYQVGRNGNRHANADIYRALEQANRIYVLDAENIERKQPRISSKSIDDLAYEYNVQCGKIWSIIETTIRQGISINKDVLTLDEVEEMEKSLIEPEIVTKEHIDSAITMAERIFASHEIYPA